MLKLTSTVKFDVDVKFFDVDSTNVKTPSVCRGPPLD